MTPTAFDGNYIFRKNAIRNDFFRFAVNFRSVTRFSDYSELTVAAFLAFARFAIADISHEVLEVSKEGFEHFGRKRTGGQVTICTVDCRRFGAQNVAICHRVALCIACVCMFSLGFLLVVFLLAEQLLKVGKVEAALFVAFRFWQLPKAFRQSPWRKDLVAHDTPEALAYGVPLTGGIVEIHGRWYAHSCEFSQVKAIPFRFSDARAKGGRFRRFGVEVRHEPNSR